MMLIGVAATLALASAKVTKEAVTIDRDTRPHQQAWDFLKAVVLTEDPKYQPYNYGQRRRP